MFVSDFLGRLHHLCDFFILMTSPLIWNCIFTHPRASLVAQMVKHLPAVSETWVRSLGREDPLDKEMATHFSILAWKISWMEELYKKDLHDPDNHDGVITHLEPDILECEVKWALESITTKKLVEVIEFQLSCFKSWKMMLWKCCTQCASKFGKLNSGHRTGKSQFSFQSQRKAMPKNAQTTAQLHSSHILVK